VNKVLGLVGATLMFAAPVPSTCFSSGLLRCPPPSPLHQKSGLSACGIGWRFSLK
jgi:hypothetical protein